MHPDKRAKLTVRNIIKNTLCSECSLTSKYDLDRLKSNCPNKECRSLIHGMIRKIMSDVVYPIINKGKRHASEGAQITREKRS